MNRTFVVSIDALISADIPILKGLPHLGPLLKDASYAEDILCVYPTLTYPCHASIVTGCYPARHGICANERFQPLVPGRADWYWFRRDIRVPTILDFARERGLSTAAVTWPVMGDSGADYTIGEIWAPREEDDPEPWFRQANSPGAEEIFQANRHLLRWMKTPQMDEFAVQCAVDIIQRHRPDLMLLHLSYLDHQRHRLGVRSPDLDKAFDFVDAQLGRVLAALEETGGVDSCNLVLLGDHGQLPCRELFHLNSALRVQGWLEEQGGRVVRYQVYGSPCGLSAQVYVQPGMDENRVYDWLLALQSQYPRHIRQVFTRAEAAAMGLAGEFSFVLEGGEGVGFSKRTDRTEFVSPAGEEAPLYRANHGHLPERGDKPPFIVRGPGARKGQVLTGGRLVDEAPTILGLLGIQPRGMDGAALDLLQ